MAFAGLGNMHHLEDHPSPDFVSLLADAVEGVQSEDSDWPLHFQQPAHARQAAQAAHPAGNLSQQPFAAPLQPQAPAYNPLSLQGDEHTWQLNDWDWDAHSLSASLKNAPPTSRGDAQIQPNKLNPYSFNGGQALHQPNPAQAHPASACCDAAGAACSFHLPTPTLTSGHATGHPAQAGLQSTSCQQPWGHSTDGANWTFPDPDPSLVGSGPQQEPWRHMAGYTAQHQHNGMAPGMPMDQQMQHVMQGSMQHGHMAAPNGHACCMQPPDMHQAGPHGNHQHALQMGGTHSNAVNAPPPTTLHSPHALPTSPWSRGSPASSSRQFASAPVPAPPPAQMLASSVSSKLMHHAAQQVIAGMPSNAHHQSAAAAAPRNDGMAEDGDDGWCSDGMEDSIRQQPQKKAKQSTQAELDAAIASGVISITDKPESEKMVCQVACCGKDLTNLKEYHQRYRICEVHIKLPAVIKDNCLQRFCQQCGRFHELSAFEGSRKSCRDQLSKHNARRRRRAQIEQLKVRSAASEAGIKPEVALASVAAALGGAVLAPGGAGDQPPGGHAPQPPGGAGGAPSAAGAEPGDISRLLSALMHNPQQLQALRLLLGVSTNAALPPLKPYSPKNCPVCDGDGACPTDSAHAASVEPASYSLARDILQGRNEFSPEYDSEHRSLRISMKLFNRTPADLPPDLKQQVCSWLDAAPTAMEGYIRPGCVYLTLQMLVTKEVYHAAMAAGLQSLLHHLQHSTGCDFWWTGIYCVQLFGQVAVLMNGQVGTCVEYVEPGMVPPAAASLDAQQQQQPLLQQAPIVAKPSVLCMVGGRPEGSALGLTGEGLDTTGLELVCRYQGRQVCTQLLPSAAGRAASTCLPHLPGCGVAVLECCKGAYASPPRPLLVVDDPALAAEVQQLAAYMVPAAAAEAARVEQEGARAGCRLGQEQVDAVLVDLGLVLQHLQGNEKPGLPLEALCLKARRLLAFACDMNWHRTAQRVLPLAVARCGTAPQAVEAVHRASAAARDGLSLLHRAVRSGNLALVSGMLHWGQQHGYAWRADHSGPGGLTPLHLAALLDDARIAVLLLDHCPREAFTRLVTHDGVTPFHLAFQMGHYDVPTLMRALHCIKVTKADGVLLQKHGRGSRASKLQKSGSRQQGQLAEVKCEPVDEVEGLDPCEHCHSTMPPLVLDVKAACTDCGEPQPCISEEEAKGNPAGASDSDADWGLPATPGKRPRDNAMGHAGAARHRATHHSELGRQPGLAALPHAVLDACVHSHGNVYCVTAMCQSCHTNRMLEVA